MQIPEGGPGTALKAAEDEEYEEYEEYEVGLTVFFLSLSLLSLFSVSFCCCCTGLSLRG